MCFLQACSVKHAQMIYHRPDIETNVSAVVVLPTTTASAEVNKSTKMVATSIQSGWSKIYGKKAIPAGPAMEQLLKNENTKQAYLKLISTLDKTSAIEQVLNNAGVKQLLDSLTKDLKLGANARIAVSLMRGTEEGYDKGSPVYINVGLFDLNSLTWKVITKTESEKSGKISNFKLDYNGIIKGHFATIEESVEKIK